MSWFIAITVIIVWMLGCAFFGKKNANYWAQHHYDRGHKRNADCECAIWSPVGWPLWFIVYPCTLLYASADGSLAEARHQKELRKLARQREIDAIMAADAQRHFNFLLEQAKRNRELEDVTRPSTDDQLVIKPPRSS